MKTFLTLLTLIFSTAIFSLAQNLVPNHSFEEYSLCPEGVSAITYASHWKKPSAGTTDYFDTCSSSSLVDVPGNFFGYQQPHSGAGYAGLYAYYYHPSYREYAEVELLSPMVAGTKYYMSFYVSLADSAVFATDDIGMYVSVDSLFSYFDDAFAVTPQLENTEGSFLTDTMNWVKISGEFTAVGGEKFLTIGNFKDDSHTDSLRVRPVSIASAAAQYIHAYYFIDDVCVTTSPGGCDYELGLSHPSTSSLVLSETGIGSFLLQSLKEEIRSPCKISVFNSIGQECKVSITEENKYGMKFRLQNPSSGIYFVQLTSDKINWTEKFWVTQ